MTSDANILHVISEEELARVFLERVVHLDITDPQERDTPKRFVKALKELTRPVHFEFTTFEAHLDEMVIVKNIHFATLCRHHILPFTGVVHVAYVPDKVIAGLSKIPRQIAYEAAGLNVQEDLTARIAHHLEEELKPKGVGVVMEAEHTCMSIRGARTNGAETQTAAMLGVFSDHTKTAKAEFLAAIR